MIFRYRGYISLLKGSKKVSGTIEAIDLEQAKAELKLKGVIYSQLKEQRAIFKNASFIKRIPSKKLSIISRNLCIYLKSGVSSIVYAIKLEKQQHIEDKKMSAFFNSIEKSLMQGKSFYSALESQHIYSLPSFYVHSIKVAEQSGTLALVLRELSSFLKKQEDIKSKISSAMAYPLFIIAVSFFMVGFMLSVVVPKITAMFDGLNQELPKITKIVIKLGDIVTKDWLYIVIFIFILIFVFLYLYRHIQSFTYFMDRMVLKLPLFGKIIETSELANFSYMVSLLIESGVTFVQAVKLSSNGIKNSIVSKTFLNASDEVVRGEKFSLALSKQDYKVDKAFIQAISLGEETSQMREILQNLSELYAQENNDKITVMLSLLEPLLILIVGAIIGVIIVAMLLPIFSINLNT